MLRLATTTMQNITIRFKTKQNVSDSMQTAYIGESKTKQYIYIYIITGTVLREGWWRRRTRGPKVVQYFTKPTGRSLGVYYTTVGTAHLIRATGEVMQDHS